MVEEENRASRVASLKFNAFYLRWLIGLPALPARIADGAVDESRMELDFETRRALAYAVQEADRDREFWIDSDHLLRGLLRFPNRAHFAILKIEMDLRTVRAHSRTDRESYPITEMRNIRVFEYRLRKYLELVVPPVISLVCYLYILIQGMGLTLSAVAR
jgi:hypothetical protein